MTKLDFLEQLENELSERLSASQIREEIEYYSRYIDEEKAAGRPEQQVIDELGDPWAIACNIIEDRKRREGVEEERREQVARDAEADRDYARAQRVGGAGRYWLVLICVILFIVLIISVVVGALGLVLRELPLLFVIIVVAWLIHRFRN